MNNVYNFKFFNDILEYKALDSSALKFNLRIRDRYIAVLGNAHLSSLTADLIDIASCVYQADRLADFDQNNSRVMNLEIEVRDLKSFRREVVVSLQEALGWFTEDTWNFTFKRKLHNKRESEIQGRIGYDLFNSTSMNCTLWSGGLDSLAGLYNHTIDRPDDNFLLIGFGTSTNIQPVQKKLFHMVQNAFLPEIQFVPISATLTNYNGKVQKNRFSRTRGFLFHLIGAATASHFKQNKLFIYENGIGAINLPLPGNVSIDQSRSVHPTSHFYMNKFVSQVYDKEFRFINPYVFQTKAEICSQLAKGNFNDFISYTVSCDSIRRAKGRPQCGYCTSCLLRKESILANGIMDKTRYYSRLKPSTITDKTVFNVVLQQIRQLQTILSLDDPWKAFSDKYQTQVLLLHLQELYNLPKEAVIEKLLQLYKQYVKEWESVTELIKEEIV